MGRKQGRQPASATASRAATQGARRRAFAGATSSSSYSGTSVWLTTMKYVIPGGAGAQPDETLRHARGTPPDASQAQRAAFATQQSRRLQPGGRRAGCGA